MPPISLLNPNMMQQAGMVNPFTPPIPPPPTSPSLGFSLWAQDAQNAMKVMPSMTDPGKLLQPGAGAPQQMASSTPPAVAPLASVSPPAVQPLASSAPPQPSQLGTDTAELQRLQNTGSGASQVKNPWGRGLAIGGDIFGSMLLGRGMAAIPGSTAHHLFLQEQQAGRVAQDQAAQTAANQNQQFKTQQQLEQAQLEQTNLGIAASKKTAASSAMEGKIVKDGSGKPIAWVDDSGVTHAPGDSAIPPGVAAVMAADAGKAPTSEFELWHRQNPTGTAEDFQKVQSKPLTAEQAQSLNAVWNPLAAKHHLPSGQFQPGMSSADANALSGALNNAIGKQQGDTRVSIDLQGLQARTAQLDTSDPAMQAAVTGVANGSIRLQDVFGRGATTAQKAQFAAAVKQVNPNWNSGDNAIENASRQYMISGQGGQTITAGNVLNHHLDLYDSAVDAVKNGDLRLMNQIGNEMGIQTGNDAQTNLALIRQGVAMEAARYYTGGVPGEAEINQFNKSLSGDGSPKQMHGGANTVRAMAKGKLQGLQGQAEAGAQGRANFNPMAPPTQAGGPKEGDTKKNASGDTVTWRSGKWTL